MQVHQVLFDLLDPLIELFELLPELRFQLRGREIARLDLVDHSLQPVAGQVDGSGSKVELEQFHVQRLELAACLDGLGRRRGQDRIIERGDPLFEPRGEDIDIGCQGADPVLVLAVERDAGKEAVSACARKR